MITARSAKKKVHTYFFIFNETKYVWQSRLSCRKLEHPVATPIGVSIPSRHSILSIAIEPRLKYTCKENPSRNCIDSLV